MPAKPRLSIERLDTLDDLEDRHRRNPSDPAIAGLITQLRAYALMHDRQMEEIALIARRGTEAPRLKNLRRDPVPDPTRTHPPRTA